MPHEAIRHQAASTNGLRLHIALIEPRIPPNTGNVIRTAAATGAHLHLVEPLGFTLRDAQLRRAGLDYHDLATLKIHRDIRCLWTEVQPARTFAISTSGTTRYDTIDYAPDDLLMFGSEPTGLSDEIMMDARVTDRIRIPMLPGRRSLNLANSVALVAYEAWRQQGFDDSV